MGDLRSSLASFEIDLDPRLLCPVLQSPFHMKVMSLRPTGMTQVHSWDQGSSTFAPVRLTGFRISLIERIVDPGAKSYTRKGKSMRSSF